MIDGTSTSMMNHKDGNSRYVLISPCRNEAKYMRRTLDSVIAQSILPALWVIVDDGSSDGSTEILQEYAARHDWIKIVGRKDLGHRLVVPVVSDPLTELYSRLSLHDLAFLLQLHLHLFLTPLYLL